MTEYLFEGETIKLNRKHFMECCEEYSNIDLVKNLKQLDMQLRNKKNWYYSMHQILGYRNNNKNYMDNNTRSRTINQQLTDNSWAN